MFLISYLRLNQTKHSCRSLIRRWALTPKADKHYMCEIHVEDFKTKLR